MISIAQSILGEVAYRRHCSASPSPCFPGLIRPKSALLKHSPRGQLDLSGFDRTGRCFDRPGYRAFQKFPYRWMRHGAMQKLGGAYDPDKQFSYLRFARLKFFHGSIK